METTLRILALTALLLVLAACGDGEPAVDLELRPAETFTWTGGQPISFSPPPAAWKSSRFQNGGTEGVDFVKAGSGGEQILVIEQFYLGRRDSCSRIRAIHDEVNAHASASFSDAIHKARRFAQDPINHHERRAADLIRGSLERAQAAFRNQDRATTQVELGRALEQAGAVRFTLEETVDRVLFTAERNTVYPALQVDPPQPTVVAGEQALGVVFRFDAHGVPFVGRRVYVIKNNRLFEIGFQGREINLPLFESIVESIEFPSGPCEH